MWYTIQVSDHPEAGARIPTEAAAASWRTVFDGETTAAEVLKAVDGLAGKWAKHARAFRGKNLGHLFYECLDMDKGRPAPELTAEDIASGAWKLVQP